MVADKPLQTSRLCLGAIGQSRPSFLVSQSRALTSSLHRVLLDDTDMLGRSGGGGFARCGIAPESGAFVVVRPDGHIGIVAPCDRIDALNNYFGAFLLVAA